MRSAEQIAATRQASRADRVLEALAELTDVVTGLTVSYEGNEMTIYPQADGSWIAWGTAEPVEEMDPVDVEGHGATPRAALADCAREIELLEEFYEAEDGVLS